MLYRNKRDDFGMFCRRYGGLSSGIRKAYKRCRTLRKSAAFDAWSFDHIMGAERFAEIFGCPVYAYEGEENILCDPVLNASATMLGQSYVFTKAEYVKADTQIETAGFQVEIIPTPGHTEGGCCYYIGEEHVLFSGDTLFHNSIGRTDLPTGSGSELVRSVREKLLVLPEDTRVYPGHMEETTISHEKKYNPFI